MTIDDLDETQLGQVLQHLLSRFDTEEPAITDEEITARVAQDRAFLDKLTAARPVRPGEPHGAEALRHLLRMLATGIPETEPVIEEAIEQIERSRILPIADVAVDILVITTSAAILRPRIKLHRSTTGQDKRLDIQMEVSGTKGLESKRSFARTETDHARP